MNNIQMIPVNIALNSAALFFYLFLIIIYLTKKNAKNIDNKIYQQLLAWNFGVLVFHLGFLIFGSQLPKFEMLAKIITKFYFVSFIGFFFYLTCYVVYLSLEKNKRVNLFINNYIKQIGYVTSTAVAFMAFVIFILPVEISQVKGNGIMATGLVNNFTNIFSFFSLIIFVGTLVKNRKYMDKMKLVTFNCTLGMIASAIVLATIYPALCFMVMLITIISYLLYHTIENPDMRQSAELQLAKDQAERANNAKSDFLSSMSHELRTPLNAIVGLSQVMIDSNNIEEIHEELKDVLLQSQNLLELVDGILDINKLEANEVELVENVYNPVEISNDLIRLIKARIGTKPIELRTNYSPSLPLQLYGDKDKIKRIMSNLLTNAVKYTNKGYIDLEVNYTMDKTKCNLIISVQDTGRGISEEQQAILFTKFSRLEQDKDSDIQGTGLGLAITKSLVDILGGEIKVESTLNVGSKFTVQIPQKVIARATNQSQESDIIEEI